MTYEYLPDQELISEPYGNELFVNPEIQGWDQTVEFIVPEFININQYRKEIRNIPVLPNDEQMSLGRLIQSAVKISEYLDSNNLVPNSEQQRIIDEANKAKNKMWIHNLRLVPYILETSFKNTIRFNINTVYSFEDLIQDGNLALIYAVSRWNPDNNPGNRFSGFAYKTIWGMVLRNFNLNRRQFNIPPHLESEISKMSKVESELNQKFLRWPNDDELAVKLETSVERVQLLRTWSQRIDPLIIDDTDNINEIAEHFSDDIDNYPDIIPNDLLIDIAQENNDEATNNAYNQSLKNCLQQGLAKLDTRDQEIIKHYYGLDGYPPKSIEEIGTIFNITRQRIYQLKSRAFNQLTYGSHRKYLKKFLEN